MGSKTTQFDAMVKKSILANNSFGITEVAEVKNLNSRYFVKEEYSEIENLIKTKDIERIKSLEDNKSDEGEYLDILAFKDQLQKEYIVTVFDSNALEQDPQVIEIYKL